MQAGQSPQTNKDFPLLHRSSDSRIVVKMQRATRREAPMERLLS
jgi:hypothetical protein